MIERALRYQTQGDDRVKRVAIGGAATFLGFFLFLPLFPVYGYVLEVIRRNLRAETGTPPAWDEFDIVELSIDGVKGGAILFVYSIAIGLVVVLPSGTVGFLGLVLGSPSLTLLGTVLGGALSLVGTVLVGVVAPVAVCNYVLRGDITAGFDVKTLRALVTRRTMLQAAGVALVVNFLVGVVSGVVGVTIIGAPVAGVVGFIGLSAVAYIWADGFRAAYEEVYGEFPTVPEGPATTTTAGGAAEPVTTTDEMPPADGDSDTSADGGDDEERR